MAFPRSSVTAADYAANPGIFTQNINRSEQVATTPPLLWNSNVSGHRTFALQQAMTDELPYMLPPSPQRKRLSKPAFRDAGDLHSSPKLLSEPPEHHDGDWTMLEPTIRSVLVHEFRKFDSQRQHVQMLRVLARDERHRMRTMRQRFQEAAAQLIQTSRLYASTPETNAGKNAEANLKFQHIEKCFQELETQEMRYDLLESDLIPAEWELNKVEREYNTRALGIDQVMLDRSGSAILSSITISETRSRTPPSCGCLICAGASADYEVPALCTCELRGRSQRPS